VLYRILHGPGGLSDCASGKALWSTELGKGTDGFQDILFTPVMAGNLLIVSGYKAGLAALDPETGKTKWRLALAAPSSAARLGTNIVVTTADKKVFVISPEGKVRNHTTLDVEFLGPPLGTESGSVIVPTDQGLAVLDRKLSLNRIYVVRSGTSARPVTVAGKLLFMDNRGVFNCLEVLQP